MIEGGVMDRKEKKVLKMEIPGQSGFDHKLGKSVLIISYLKAQTPCAAHDRYH